MKEENHNLLDEFALKKDPKDKRITMQQRSMASLIYSMVIFGIYTEIDSNTKWNSYFAHYVQFVFKGVLFGLMIVAIAISMTIVLSPFGSKNIPYRQRLGKMLWQFLLVFSLIFGVIFTLFVLVDLSKILF